MNQHSSMASDAPGCETTRSLLLDLTNSQQQRTDLARALAHLQICESCQAVMRDFDNIGAILTTAGQASETDPLLEAAASQWVDRALQELSLTHRPRSRFSPYIRLAAAACVIVSVGTGAYLLGRVNHPVAGHIEAPEVVASIPPLDVSERVKAFQTLNTFYGDHAGWMLISGSDSAIGLDPELSSDQKMVVIRLMITRRNDSGGLAHPKSIVSSADLAILPGRTARLSLPFSNGRLLSYEISVGTETPARLGVLAEVHSANKIEHSKPLAALSTMLDMQAGGYASAGSFVTGNSDYELTVGFSNASLSPQASEGGR